MGTTYLVRHGQASFGAADYDQLSPLGIEQCRRLGRYWRERDVTFDAVLCGTLRRQQQTVAAIADGLGQPLTPLLWPGLNEYDSGALVRAVHPGPLPEVDDAAGFKLHFRLLRNALLAWMAGDITPAGLPAHADWLAGARAALDHVTSQHPNARVLVASSGGPIANLVGQLLGATPEAVVELNLRIRNSAVTELARSKRGHRLLSFNHLPHLDSPGDTGLHTYT
jgi:broad specificity phosphatase PhoE